MGRMVVIPLLVPGNPRDRRRRRRVAPIAFARSSQERTGIVTLIRSCAASHAGSNQEIAATAM